MGKKRLARQGTPDIAAFSFCMLQAAGKLRLRRIPFCLGGHSSDEANPSEGGEMACEACTARVVRGPGVF